MDIFPLTLLDFRSGYKDLSLHFQLNNLNSLTQHQQGKMGRKTAEGMIILNHTVRICQKKKKSIKF